MMTTHRQNSETVSHHMMLQMIRVWQKRWSGSAAGILEPVVGYGETIDTDIQSLCSIASLPLPAFCAALAVVNTI